jgi:S-adenosylhomocysteine hydrolase
MSGSTEPVLSASEFTVTAAAAKALGLAAYRPFEDFDVLAVQHANSSLLPLLTGLLVGGADAARITVVVKAYSARPEAVSELDASGVRVVLRADMNDPTHSYEDEIAAIVGQMLDEVGEHASRLLVIDEGAIATQQLATRPELAARTRVVEQTTRGARWDSEAALRCPVVDVARSSAKSSLEGPLVIKAMLRGTDLIKADLKTCPVRPGVVGFGRIGSRIARELARDNRVLVADPDPARARDATGQGLTVVPTDELLNEADWVFGCTGLGILSRAALARAAGSLVLVNTASSDVEFPVWGERTRSAIVTKVAGDWRCPWGNHYRLDGGHLLAIGGFPANFHPRATPIPSRAFEVTRALMLCGAMQAVRAAGQAGVVPLARELEALIFDAASRGQASSGR